MNTIWEQQENKDIVARYQEAGEGCVLFAANLREPCVIISENDETYAVFPTKDNGWAVFETSFSAILTSDEAMLMQETEDLESAIRWACERCNAPMPDELENAGPRA